MPLQILMMPTADTPGGNLFIFIFVISDNVKLNKECKKFILSKSQV